MMPGTRQTLLERIPKGFRNKAQGCEERATLGKGGGQCFTTPTGLWPRYAAIAVGRNPFRVVVDQHARSQGSSFLATLGFGAESLWDSAPPAPICSTSSPP